MAVLLRHCRLVEHVAKWREVLIRQLKEDFAFYVARRNGEDG